MPFRVPMVWWGPTNHFGDCYICLDKTEGYSIKEECKIELPNVPLAIMSVPHGGGLPIPTPSVNSTDIDLFLSEEEDQPHTTDSVVDPTHIPQDASATFYTTK
ncbi:hypothetical protein PR048_006171 [Dryococelus australis]|uniref:Uncharacterized protein n=1 Tax=Dryococelus australis TaxID=614101 RepID=A0ABQ9IB71_9NEOP|nr:hypothetical protein PR048_006171 [Dryococelus australis]